MQGIYGQTITANTDGTWTRGGVHIGSCDVATALNIFNSMLPDGITIPSIHFTQIDKVALLFVGMVSNA